MQGAEWLVIESMRVLRTNEDDHFSKPFAAYCNKFLDFNVIDNLADNHSSTRRILTSLLVG
eukprot:scaffold30824_cov228-Skeletonema_menzelii.AAC.2